jgi:hypothetical protein
MLTMTHNYDPGNDNSLRDGRADAHIDQWASSSRMTTVMVVGVAVE